jgi:hypothetical protein
MLSHPLAALVGLVGGAIAGASGATSLADNLFPAGAGESLTDRPLALTFYRGRDRGSSARGHECLGPG